jgi:M-phase inducer tyrosine phosphatase
MSASPSGKSKKASPYGSGGLPGFGDNEMDGKILPCYKVKEDGLVRVAPETVCDLLAGKYNSKIKRYHIIDCRFEYEYEGGHIENAIHVKEMGTLDSLLLSASSGVHAGGEALPQPSRSGELGDGEQVVLIFHCEFSAKRAPTLYVIS